MGSLTRKFTATLVNALDNWQPIVPQPAALQREFDYYVLGNNTASTGYNQILSVDAAAVLEFYETLGFSAAEFRSAGGYTNLASDSSYSGTPTTDALNNFQAMRDAGWGVTANQIPGAPATIFLKFTFTEDQADKTKTWSVCCQLSGALGSSADGTDSDGVKICTIPGDFLLMFYPLTDQRVGGALANTQVFPYVSANGVNPYRTEGDNAPVVRKIQASYTDYKTNNISDWGSITDDELTFYRHALGITDDREDTEDPFAKGGYSAGHVGGGGDFDTSSDPIPVPDLPSSDVLTCGMFRLYMPTAEQVKEFSDYLWSENFVIDNVKKLFNDPMQSILGLSVIPADASPTVNDVVSFNGISTGITMPRVGYEYVSISCGSIDVSEFWGAYLDYAPYTSFQLYLPYIGIRPLAVDDVMGGSLSVTYHVNVITGACVCFVSCGDRVLYTYSGSCATEIPVTASNWTSAITGAINIAASIGSMVASGGATAPLAVANMAGTAANQLKPQVEKSGAMSGGAAILGIQYPYLIITRPIQCVPEEQNAYTGYPAFVTVTLGNETGWTVVQSIHLDGVSCTAAEKDEIMNLLTTGVIIA